MSSENDTTAQNGSHTMDDDDIIVPPPAFREIIDKTAQFVAKNGQEFEERIMRTSQSNVKFNFLRMDDPYHPFYKKRVEEFRSGPDEEMPEEKEASAEKQAPAEKEAEESESKEAPAQETPTQAASVTSKVALTTPLAEAAKRVPKDRAPAPFEFIADHPSYLPPVELEIIKLTAQYTAVSGRQFLSGLANREHKNPQFDFLRPTHALFGYFMQLVDQYNKVLNPLPPLRGHIQKLASEKFGILDRAVHRYEHEREEEEKRQRSRNDAEADRIAFYSIDWHDFVLVETIEFDDSELLPAPKQQQQQHAGRAEGVGDDMEVDDMEVDEEPATKANAPPTSVSRHKHHAASAAAAARPPPPRHALPPASSAATAAAAPRRAPDDDEVINVRMDYDPQREAAKAAAKRAGLKHFIDPQTGRQLPIEQASEHMRIELMDPNWAIEKQKQMEKAQEMPYAPGDDVAENLRRMAKRRSDIFGSGSAASQNQSDSGTQPQPVQWDGFAGSAATAEASARRNLQKAMHEGYDPNSQNEIKGTLAGPQSKRQKSS